MTADPYTDPAALPEQDAGIFRAVLGENPGDRRRLQELAEAIPLSDGCGDDLDKAKAECDRLRGELAMARQEADRHGHRLAVRYSQMHEERDILSRLGLTQNLYRSHPE